MPRGDGTGPAGMGPMTGRGAGYCAGFSIPGFMSSLGGRPFRGRGGGRGRRNMFYATGLPGWARSGYGFPAYAGMAPYGTPYAPAMGREDELDMLKAQSEDLADALERIKKRIEELETGSGK